MKNLILFAIILGGLQVAKANVEFDCSVPAIAHEVSGIKFEMSNDQQFKAKGSLYFRDFPITDVKGTYKLTSKLINSEKMIVALVSLGDQDYRAQIELFQKPGSLYPMKGNISVTNIHTGELIANKQSMKCEFKDTNWE